ncbi:MAG: RCC1 domain-containing protein, partial [Roseiflexaceae bacterium]
ETPTDTETPTETETNTPTYTSTSTITLTPSITPTDTPLPYLKNGGFESGVTYWSTVTSIVDIGVTQLGGNPGDANRCVSVDTQDYSRAAINGRPVAYNLMPDGTIVAPNIPSGAGPTSDNNTGHTSTSRTVSNVSTIANVTSGGRTYTILPSEGTKSIKLTFGSGSGSPSYGYHIKHGPAIYSNYFRALTGQVITLDWFAKKGDDDAAVLGYLLDADVNNNGIPAENAADCQQFEILDATVSGVSGWQFASVTVPQNKDYYSFVFVGGTFDKTGGNVSGADFWVDNISQGQPQTITFAPAPLDNAYNYSASYVSSPVDTLPGVTGFATATSGFPVQYISNTPSVCTVSSRYTINFVGSGTCTLTASQPGGVDNAGTLWASAPVVQGSFLVSNQMYTVTPSNTPTDTRTPSNTRTPTRTFTNTRTSTPTDTATDTATPTATNTATNTRTFTRTRTNTWTPSSTRTRSNTPTNTETDTPTETDTNTPTDTSTPTKTFTRTNTPTRTLSPSRTFTPVPNLDTLKKVSVGNSFVLGLLNDDTLVMWGDNRHGQTTIPPAIRTMRFDDIATGHTSAYGLGIDGRVYAWGSNDFGEGSVPVAAQSNVKAISAGGRVAAAVRTDGTVVLWGLMVHGQRTIPRGLNRVIDVAVGYRHVIALKDDGTVVCWGESKSCGAVPQDLRDVVKVAASDGYSLALKDDGTVVAFGMNLFGELNVPRTAIDVAQIGAGQGFAVALKNDGTLVGWGRATTGAIAFPPTLNDAVLVSAANVNTVIMRRNGDVQSFGLPLFNALVSRTRTRTPIITLTPSLPRAINTLTPSNTKTASPTPTLTRSIVPTRTR